MNNKKKRIWKAVIIVMAIAFAVFVGKYQIGMQVIFGAVMVGAFFGVFHNNIQWNIYYLYASVFYYIAVYAVRRIQGIPTQVEPLEQVIYVLLLIMEQIFLLILMKRSARFEEMNRRKSQSFEDLLKVVDAKKKVAQNATRAKADFLANMSHEIRTPMNAIIGMSEMAMREEISPEVMNDLYQIQAAGKGLLAIINDILDFSKIESGKMEIVPAEYEWMSMVNDVVNIVRTRIGNKHLKLLIELDHSIPHRLFGDDIRIKQVLVNLANNAVKFSESGFVRLKIERGKQNAAQGRIVLTFSVEDSGIGIKEEDMGKLFGTFQQVDTKRNRSIEGSGLGLSISAQLVTLMGGELGVSSEYGVGSKFYFTIEQQIVEVAPSLVLEEKHTLQVAVVSANQYVLGTVREMLRQFGVDYTVCTTLKGAELVQAKQPQGDNLFVFGWKDTEAEEAADVICTQLKQRYPKAQMVLFDRSQPVFALPVYSALKREDMIQKLYAKQEKVLSFEAPEAEVLIVDDNAINLKVAAGLLAPLQMQIDTASSGQETLEKVTQKHYDLIFMDHMMPDMDGLETTKAIRALSGDYYEQVPIIALTANALSGAKEMFIANGMQDFVAKPIDMKEITEKLSRWLSKELIVPKTDAKMQKNLCEETAELDLETAQPDRLSEWEQALRAAAILDVETALSFVGTSDLYQKTLQDYYHAIEQDAAAIEQCVEQEDVTNYTVHVHALKSIS